MTARRIALYLIVVGVIALASAAAATGCSGPTDPVGVYESDPESFARAVEETNLPEGTSPELRERFAQLKQEQASGWRITLELTGDHRFALTMVLPMVPTPRVRAGTWRQSGSEITLLPAADDTGRESPPMRAILQGDGVLFQQDELSPSFALQRRRD